jgi:outer membrane murein-binding lipoprotein Lpp
MRRSYLFFGLIAAAAISAVGAWRLSVNAAGPGVAGQPDPADPAAAKTLPLTQVILFNSGVGYFQREGEIDGAQRVDLSFPVSDVNDLLKSLVLPDVGDGKVTAVSYDGQEPVEKTLKSFALDLTNNPTLGQLVNQARGEKVEVTLQQSGGAQPGALTGAVIGMEVQHQPGPKDSIMEVDVLNLKCAEGVRAVRLSDVLRMRFLNPTLDSEFNRALDVLATAHNSLKRTVSLNFTGDGKRTAKVGYVVENPIWKTTYRLVLGKNGKPTLQGWALVENTSDEDWKDVRMALISSRPISFRMDLYQPLFLPRPMVEPELFASLRPPTYQGALAAGQVPPNGNLGQGGGFNFGGGGGFNFGNMGGAANPGLNRYQQVAGQNGQLGNSLGQNFNPNNDNNTQNFANNKLSYEELQQRRQQLKDAKEKAKALGSAAALDPTGAAAAEEVGEYFQYNIDQKVSLPRQKSAMLPIVNGAVEGSRVSIFNEAVQAKFPLLGLKFKNTTGQSLMQGPASVFENGAYAGDARLADLQPDEERLISYAIDQGVEVKADGRSAPEQLIAVKIAKGVMQVTHKLRDTKTYTIRNRSPQDRRMIVEHPIRSDWKLIAPDKPAEYSRDVYRFEVDVPAGKTVKQEVLEERSRVGAVTVASTDDKTVKLLLAGDVAGPKVKEAIRKAQDMNGDLLAVVRDRDQMEKQLKAITDDQTRIRANLDKVPPSSAAYKRYLEKFDQQETEIEKLQKQIADKLEAEKTKRAAYEDYLAGLTVE